MKINPVGVEAYRKAGAANSHERQAAIDASQVQTQANIILPGTGTDIGSVRAQMSPSILGNALSLDEKEQLTKYFARFGDKPAEPPVYGLQAWRDAFSESGIWRSLWNSIRVGVALQARLLGLYTGGSATRSILSPRPWSFWPKSRAASAPPAAKGRRCCSRSSGGWLPETAIRATCARWKGWPP